VTAAHPADRQRIDKWLWHARVVRTRSAAAALADGGRIRVNGQRIEAASRAVRIGDVVTVALLPVRVLKVTGFSERRGSASDAACLCESLAESGAQKRDTPGICAQAGIQLSHRSASHRPNKRQRRDIIDVTRPGKG
jgi:ribosome-associated heat shock protein Hsp15